MKIVDKLWRLYALAAIPNFLWLIPIRAVFRVLGRQMDIQFHKDLGLFRIVEQGLELYVARRTRLRLFHRGLRGRLDYLVDSYSVPPDAVGAGDIVIDCGANVGEFSVAMELNGATVHAFEPDDEEFQALSLNLARETSTAWHFGCSSSTGWAYLDRKNEQGDSKLLGPNQNPAGLQKIPTTSLDDWAEKNLSQDASIKLLKLEAEGGELAVLMGATNVLKRTRFICADLGEGEDGVENAVAPVVSFLLSRGYTILSFTRRRCMTVFQNSEL